MDNAQNQYNIRIAGSGDIDVIFEIRTSVQDNHLSIAQLAELNITPKTLPAMLNYPGRGWVAEHRGETVAFSMANAQEAKIFAMFVRPEYEGKGIGRQLMLETEQWLFSQGCQEIWLLTDSNPEVRANGFYRYLGWEITDQIEDGEVKFIKQARSLDSVAQSDMKVP